MGCDIHLIVQQKVTYGAHHQTYWRAVLPPAWWPRDAYDAEFIAEDTAKLPDAAAAASLCRRLCEWYGGRNYHLFGILADVRNGSGFAGIKTLDTAWPSIAPSRGLPPDLELEDGRTIDLYPAPDKDLGDHSFTWLTVAELLAFDWANTHRAQSGVVPLTAFAEHHTTGTPYESWSGDVFGGGTSVIDRDTALSKLHGGGIAPMTGQSIYVRDTWPITARDACEWFVDTIIPAFQRYCTENALSPADVRLVMGFDS